MVAERRDDEEKERLKKIVSEMIDQLVEELNLFDGCHLIIDRNEQLKAQLAPIFKNLSAWKSPSSIHVPRYIPRRWRILEGRDVFPTLASIAELELVPFIPEDDCLRKGELPERSLELGATLGLADAVWLLNHRSEIPLEWEPHLIIFAGTVLRDWQKQEHVPYLERHLGEEWRLDFCSIECNFDDEDCRLAARKTPTP